MSRKKNKKIQSNKIEPVVIEAVAPSEKKEEEVKTPTKKEQISNMLFNDFLKGAMKIFNYVDNDFLTITPYMDKDAEEKDDGSDIVCYEIVSKSNPNIVVYIDDKDTYVSLKGSGVTLNDDEVAYLAANILGFVKSHCPIAA